MNNSGNPSVSGFIGNAFNDIGNVATGLFSLPGAVAQAFKNPQQGGQMVKNVISGTAQEYNKLAGNPVTYNKGKFGLQMPNLAESASQVYSHPVDTAMDLLPFAKPAMEVAMAGKAGKAADLAANIGKSAAEEAATTGNAEIPNVLKPVTNKAAGSTTPNISDLQAKTFLQGYTVPRAVAADGNFNPVNVAKQIMDDGHFGGPADLAQKFAPVVGSDGVVERIKRAVLGNAPSLVKMDNASEVVNNLASNVPELAGNKAKTMVYQSQLRNMLPKAQAAGNDVIAGSQPLEAYDSMRAIFRQGYDYISQGQDAQGHVINAEKVNVGKQFLNAANGIRDELNGAVQDNNLIDHFKTPSVQMALQQFSPNFAQRFMDNTHNFSDLQALQAPYVKMGQMIKSTMDASATAGSKFGGNISRGVGTAVGTGLGSMFGPVGAVGGAVAGNMIAPAAEEVASKFLPFVSAKVAQAIPNMQANLSKAGNALAGVAPFVAGATENGQDQQGGGVEGATTIPGSLANPDGTYSLPTQVQNPTGALMTEQQREQAEANLTPGTPEYTKIEQQFAQSQKFAQNALSGEKMTFMQNAKNYVTIGNEVKQSLQALPPNFMNHFKSWSDIRQYASNPKNPYATQLADIDALNTQFSAAYQQINGKAPGENQLIGPGMSPDQAIQKWDGMMQFMVGNYQQHLEPYLVLTSPAGSQSQQFTPVASGVSQPPAQENASSIVGGSIPQLNIPQVNVPQFQGGASAFPQR